MIMTEEEAKTKWCPMARVAVNINSDVSVSVNRLDGKAELAMCLGSSCMTWCASHAAGKGYCGLAGI